MPGRTSPFLVEPEQFRTLLALAERKSFSAAAAALGIQQSAVSHQIRRVEERLGRRLFIRSGIGVEPTMDGKALIVYGRAMMNLDSSMRRYFQEPGIAVTLRIGIVEDLNRTALPTVLWLFSREHPLFEFKIASDLPMNLMQQVEEGRLAAAIVRHRGELVDVEPLWKDQLVWVGRADTQLPIVDPVPLVLPPVPSTLRELVTESMEKAGRSWRVLFEGVSLASLEAWLRAGIGISAFPSSMERFGCSELGAAAGLPSLTEMQFAISQASSPASDGASAFCQMFRDAARLSHRTAQPLPI